MHPVIIAAALTTPPVQAQGGEAIVVTAHRTAESIEDTAASVTIVGEEAIDDLNLPLASDLLRLLPGVSVSASGPKGTQTQLRIRGAEANHTLLFVDGIRFNDPAANNEARFELLTGDALSRVELVRGPQSALWGSEALGGVVALSTADPLASEGISALGEYGSLDTVRASAQFAERMGDVGLSGSAGWISSDGIDSFGSGGERDGFDNASASLKAVYAPSSSSRIGIVGHYVEGTSEFDGYDPVTFRRADTLDSTENRLFAVRGFGSTEWSGWSASADLSYLDSANHNRLDADPLNSTFGDRLTIGGQLSREFRGHSLTGAIEYEDENYRARDRQYFGATDQDRSRDLTAFVGEWRGRWSDTFETGFALRHDSFSAFKDATTFRASALFRPAEQWTIHASYGEGIAQPTFNDLYGFYPGSFVGNPAIGPESSRGWEAGVRWQSDSARVGVIGFSSRLRNEIVDVYDPVTFLSSTENADGKSKRDGVEMEASYALSGAISLLANYTYLDADQQQRAGDALVREVRRPRHSANLTLTGSSNALRWGVAVAYVGARGDTDFDLFPTARVRLDDYMLASLNVGYRLTDAVEAFARVENGFDASYQDVVGYNTAGRTVHAGFRVRLGD